MIRSLSVCSALIILNMGTLVAYENVINYEPQNEIAVKATPEQKKNNGGTSNKSSVPEPMDLLPSQPCPDRWRYSGDFLYLLPTLDDTYYVIDSGFLLTTFPNGERKNNDIGFSPAFRVGAEYAFCDTHRELQAFFSHLTVRQERTVAGSHLWATVGRADLVSSFESYGGSATSILNLLYQHLDVNFSQQILNSYGMYFYIQPGMEYAYLRLDEDYAYQITGSSLGTVDQKSRAWGVGPQIGLGLDYNFYQGSLTCKTTHAFSITSLFSGSILMGRAKTDNFQTLAGATVVNVTDEHTWRTLPAFHARVGLNYLIHGSRCSGSLGVGYEFNSYVRALSRVAFPDDVADGFCTTNYYNFDIQGLYVSAALSF